MFIKYLLCAGHSLGSWYRAVNGTEKGLAVRGLTFWSWGETDLQEQTGTRCALEDGERGPPHGTGLATGFLSSPAPVPLGSGSASAPHPNSKTSPFQPAAAPAVCPRTYFLSQDFLFYTFCKFMKTVQSKLFPLQMSGVTFSCQKAFF